ncbi:hypothetical protein [Desulfobacter latus]|uniref:Dockerin domain-containing protein n=1 Tax=Desulfobacter latus TaxID=2292 RepID=A0A850TBN3_9BACT|nr:hypothetical protein [Desulfobacter latus]NWH05647.1 hypothetical protein [Desulfobacter latus]
MNKQIPILLLGLLFACFSLPGVLYAKFEPSAITIDGVQTDAVQAVPEGNLDAVVEATTEDTTGYTINKYVYVWNNSITPLNNTQLGVESSSVNYIEGNDTIISVDAETTFASSNGLAWYLHVKTVYFSPDEGGMALSDDTVTPAYTFDNVAPTATIALDTDASGQTESTSASNSLIIEVSGETAEIFKVYVHTSDQFTATSKKAYDFSDPAQTTLEYTVDGPGTYTLYAWFEDEVGNVSQDPATLPDVKVLAGKSIDPAGDMNLEVGGTITFEVSGADEDETFNWEIVDANTGAASEAADFDGANSDVATVTVKGTEGGTVKVKATPTGGGDAYESGIITIIKKSQAFCLDIDGDGQIYPNTDGFLVVRYLLGTFPGDYLTNGAIGPDATRETADEITEYLDSVVADLSIDIDGDGQIYPNTDGFLVVRYLLGTFPGDYLINGVIGPEATRSTASEISAYLDAAKCGL